MTNMLIEQDTVEAMKDLPPASIDLIYADPPFNTGRDFNADEGGYTDKPDLDNQASMLYPPHTETSQRSRLPEGSDVSADFSWIQDIATPIEAVYYEMLIAALLQIHRLLKPSGAYYHHCDWRTSPVMRLILNQIFGRAAFRNEIAWHYQISMPYDTIKNIYKNDHDAILFYAGDEHTLTPQYHPLTYQQIKEMYKYVDSKGRRYRHKYGLYQERIYADENKGTRIGTTWTDIPIAPAKERTGYPTQKPVALLKRIIKASSRIGDTVLDPYCGSGTTCVAAEMLGRYYIGIDANDEAIHISERRLS